MKCGQAQGDDSHHRCVAFEPWPIIHTKRAPRTHTEQTPPTIKHQVRVNMSRQFRASLVVPEAELHPCASSNRTRCIKQYERCIKQYERIERNIREVDLQCPKSEGHKMTHRHPGLLSLPSRSLPVFEPLPSSSSTTSWGLMVMCTT